MNQEQLTIGYDEFFLKPRNERINIFNEISAENRALLIKTHVERWSAANRPRLTGEQIAVLKEIISYIIPERYRAERDMEKIHLEAEGLRRKAEAAFSREDIRQILSDRLTMFLLSKLKRFDVEGELVKVAAIRQKITNGTFAVTRRTA